MRVADIMSPRVYSCLDSDSLNTATQVMWENDCGAVPIVDAEGRLVGIVTDRDACMAAYTQGKPLAEIAVTTPMASEVITCAPEDTVIAAEERMQRYQIRRLPVVDDERRVVGMLSLNDIACRGLSPSEVAVTMAAVCRPRGTALSEPRRAKVTRRSAAISIS
jgi:CBS domain-containing protein